MILTTLPEIRAAIATMNPIARSAAETFAGMLLNDRAIVHDEENLVEACEAAMAHAYTQVHRVDDFDSCQRFAVFLESNSEAIWTVGLSIAALVAKGEWKQKWGWLGTAAAVGVGAILGSIFG